MSAMFKVKVEYYRNDYDKGYETRYFDSLESIKNYLIEENEKRDPVSRLSPSWRNPVGTIKYPTAVRGWFRTRRTPTTYSLWLKTVQMNDTVIFEENVYCSQKFFEFLEELKKKLEEKPIFGEIFA